MQRGRYPDRQPGAILSFRDRDGKRMSDEPSKKKKGPGRNWERDNRALRLLWQEGVRLSHDAPNEQRANQLINAHIRDGIEYIFGESITPNYVRQVKKRIESGFRYGDPQTVEFRAGGPDAPKVAPDAVLQIDHKAEALQAGAAQDAAFEGLVFALVARYGQDEAGEWLRADDAKRAFLDGLKRLQGEHASPHCCAPYGDADDDAYIRGLLDRREITRYWERNRESLVKAMRYVVDGGRSPILAPDYIHVSLQDACRVALARRRYSPFHI